MDHNSLTWQKSTVRISAACHKHMATALKKNCEAGRIIGPFSTPPLNNFCTSGLGLVPKHNGEWRVIYHLSAPVDFSINDFINSRHTRYKCTKYELIGKLSFAYKVLPAGRTFLRRLIDLSTKVQKMHYHIRLTADARLDLQQWLKFLPQCSGKSLILNSQA